MLISLKSTILVKTALFTRNRLLGPKTRKCPFARNANLPDPKNVGLEQGSGGLAPKWAFPVIFTKKCFFRKNAEMSGNAKKCGKREKTQLLRLFSRSCQIGPSTCFLRYFRSFSLKTRKLMKMSIF